MVIIGPNPPEKLTKYELGQVIILSNLVCLPLFGPKILFFSIFKLFTYIYPYLPTLTPLFILI